jgi:RNA polymerase sigma-70 factor (ECF subfamily)
MREKPEVLMVSGDVKQKNMSDASDALLVERCLMGDRQIFRVLYQRYQHKVRSTLYQLCGTQCLDDLVQDVFLRVWKGLPKLKNPKQFSTWLYRITWNVASDRRQQFAKQRSNLQTLNHQAELTTSDASDLTHLHYQDLVQRGLVQLSFDHRTILVLHDLEDLPQKQIAEILELPIGTVKSRLFHARGAMRKFLEQQGVQL